MKTEKGVIMAVYKPKDIPRFAVLKRKKNWEGWELPKGHLEDGDYRKTVKTELEEETGIDPEQIEEIQEMDEKVEWSFQNGDGEEEKREYRGFLVKVNEDAHVSVWENPHDEHESGFFFRFRDVEKMLTYENQVELLQKAKEKINEES